MYYTGICTFEDKLKDQKDTLGEVVLVGRPSFKYTMLTHIKHIITCHSLLDLQHFDSDMK